MPYLGLRTWDQCEMVSSIQDCYHPRIGDIKSYNNNDELEVDFL